MNSNQVYIFPKYTYTRSQLRFALTWIAHAIQEGKNPFPLIDTDQLDQLSHLPIEELTQAFEKADTTCPQVMAQRAQKLMREIHSSRLRHEELATAVKNLATTAKNEILNPNKSFSESTYNRHEDVLLSEVVSQDMKTIHHTSEILLPDQETKPAKRKRGST